MTKEEIYLRTIEKLFEEYPVRVRYTKRGKKTGSSPTRQHRHREAALTHMHQLVRMVNHHNVYVRKEYNDYMDFIKTNLVRGGISKAVVTGVFALLD